MSIQVLVLVAAVTTVRCGLLGGGAAGLAGGLTKGLPGEKQLKLLNSPIQKVDGLANLNSVQQTSGVQQNIDNAAENAQDIQRAAAPVSLDLGGDKFKVKNKGKPKKGKKVTTTTTPEPEPEEEEEEKQEEDDD